LAAPLFIRFCAVLATSNLVACTTAASYAAVHRDATQEGAAASDNAANLASAGGLTRN
jgi:hypothetical protein